MKGMNAVPRFALSVFFGLFVLCYSTPASAQECTPCHPGGDPSVVIRNCVAAGCHDTGQNGSHHATGLAFAGQCSGCHSPDLVADYDQALNPLSMPLGDSGSPVTVLIQNCRNCHWDAATPVDENGDPYPHPLYRALDCEHMGWAPGDYVGSNCVLCHGGELPGEDFDFSDPYHIRYCEACHSPEKIHSIYGHIESGYWYDESGAWVEIAASDRCLGCHNGTGGCEELDCRPNPLMQYVPQTYFAGPWIGTYDTLYTQLDADHCRLCHGMNTAERHHFSEAALPCEPPQAPPVIDTSPCQGMAPIVGARNAEVTLTGSNFGESQCEGFEVQVRTEEPPGNWVDIPGVTSWSDSLITWSLPPQTFTPYQYHEVRVKNPAANSNGRNFYVLPRPMVSHLKDNTGGDAQGPIGGWLKILSKLDTTQPVGNQGTLGVDQVQWFEDLLGGACPDLFGATYVVTLTSSSDRFSARIYDKWNVSGNKDSFKVRLRNLWRDDDSDYHKDSGEPSCGPKGDYPLSSIPPGRYSVQVCLIIFADSNADGQFSGDEDAIYQVVTSESNVVYELNDDPFISKLSPKELEPANVLTIKGWNFGDTQEDSTVRVGPKTYGPNHRKITLWSNTKIQLTIRNYKCEWFRDGEFRRRKVWVTVGGATSNKKQLKVLRPASCD